MTHLGKEEGLTEAEIQDRGEAILGTMPTCSIRDTVRILNTAIGLAVCGNEPELTAVLQPANPYIRRRSAGGYKVARDPEIEDFINKIDHYLTIDDIRKALVKRFGKVRVPSRSALGRYLQKVSKSNLVKVGKEVAIHVN